MSDQKSLRMSLLNAKAFLTDVYSMILKEDPVPMNFLKILGSKIKSMFHLADETLPIKSYSN